VVKILLIYGIMMASCMDVQESWVNGPEETGNLDILALEILENQLIFTFSDPLLEAEVNWGSLSVDHWELQDNTLRADLAKALVPGQGNEVFLSVRAKGGRENVFLQRFYAPNPKLPVVVINEILNQGSSSHPDALELLCLQEGNLAGLTLRTTAPQPGSSWEADAYVFPPTEVQAGDLLILHCKPSGDPEERDEIENQSASGGQDSHENAWDFWWPQAPGLSGTDGMIALLSQPDGLPFHGVFYSNKRDNPGRYSGFGTKKAQLSAQYLADHGLWFSEEIGPQGSIDNRYSTSTRTLNRRTNGSTPHNGQAPGAESQWFTAPTRGSSLGEENIDYDLRYIP
jgi:hypothetical protein